MKASELNLLFAGVETGARLSLSIRPEVDNYVNLLKKKGASIQIVLHEDEDIVVDQESLTNLLRSVLVGHLSIADLAYICDGLTLCERVDFTCEDIKNMIFDFSDPEINGDFADLGHVKSLLAQWEGKSI